MADFFQLPIEDRLELLQLAADRSGRPTHLLEKDIWVVWALQKLFASHHGKHLVFKGGTSLSKAYGVIRRFSEDVDLTYDIRAIASDLVGDLAEPIPTSNAQQKKWTKEIRSRLDKWITDEITPYLQQHIEQQQLAATLRTEEGKAFIDYSPLYQGTGYVSASVLLEFGARSTGEPCELKAIVCDAAAYAEDIGFPTATPQVMRAERTFWEKATAAHVFCEQGRFRGGERYSRHWHDLIRLDSAGFADAAISDSVLAKTVADHKSVFFSEKSADGTLIDYHSAVTGKLKLVPDNEARKKLSEDYQHMIDDGLFLDEVESFDALLEKCRIIENKTNKK